MFKRTPLLHHHFFAALDERPDEIAQYIGDWLSRS